MRVIQDNPRIVEVYSSKDEADETKSKIGSGIDYATHTALIVVMTYVLPVKRSLVDFSTRDKIAMATRHLEFAKYRNL